MVVLLPLNLAQTYAKNDNLSIVEVSGIPQASMPKILYRDGARPLPPVGHRLIEHIVDRFAAP